MNCFYCWCFKPISIHCKIIFLDETELIQEVKNNNQGQVLLDIIFRHLNLIETAYFGLRFLDQDGQPHWLDPNKRLSQQLKSSNPITLYFGVKFYAADPCKLVEEITRYQFFLQLKQDILQGRLIVPFDLAAELGAYILQSELGDYDERRHNYDYVSEFRFLPNQSIELEMRIAELHKSLLGQMPEQAESSYLDKVKWLDMYGVDLHPVLGDDHVEYFLGLTPNGIMVLKNKHQVGMYLWPRIIKLYFKGRYFMLRVMNNDEHTYGFETPSKSACKHLWKCCVEHHAFFRLVQAPPTTPDIFALGSRFRYSGRTEKQAVRDAQMKPRQPPTFSRNPSKRYQRRQLTTTPGSNPADITSSPSIIQSSQPQSTNRRNDHHVQQYQPNEIKHISLPLPADNFDTTSSYHSNTLKSTTTNSNKRFDSPRSTRSAPWSQPHSKGLYNNSVPPSPRSVRSGSRYRSSSVDSHSSNDSRKSSKKRNQRNGNHNHHHHHRHRRNSDSESEMSKTSTRRRHHQQQQHQRRSRKSSRGSRKDSGSENESAVMKSSSDRNYYELVDSGLQWQEAQLKNNSLAGGGGGGVGTGPSGSSSIQQATVVTRNSRSGTSGSNKRYDNGSGTYNGTTGRQHKHRKHRSRSRSPGESKWLSDELKKHLEFDLVDTAGMSDLQLKEIPYTVVKTNYSKHIKLKSPNNNIDNSNELLDTGGGNRLLVPPPLPPPPSVAATTSTYSHQYFTNDGPLYNTMNTSNNNNNNKDLLTNYSYSEPSSRISYFNGANFLNNETFTNFSNRIQHEHSDSGLGVESQEGDVKRLYKN